MQDQFTATEVRDVIPDIMKAVLDQTHVLYRPLMDISPVGYDTSKFGRVGSSKVRRYYGGNVLVNSKDGTHRISRSLVMGKRKVTVSINRECKYSQINGKYGHQFYNEFVLNIQVNDYELALPYIGEEFYTFSFRTRKVKYDGSKSFRDFLVQDMTEEYNNFGGTILDGWNKKKDEMRSLLVGIDKYK